MQIPLNAIHWYIGWPIVLAIALRSLSVRNTTHNAVNTLFGATAWGFVVSLTFYGLPPLLTLNSQILTITTIIADTFQFLALLFAWLAVARIYFPGNRVATWAIGLTDAAVVLIGVYISVVENLANPVTMTMINGSWQLNFAFPLGYQVVTAIQYVSLLLMAAKFWVQGGKVGTKLQMIRLRSFALGFLCIGGFYVVRPFINTASMNGNLAQNLILVIGLAVFGGFAAATFYLGRFQSADKSQ